MPIQGSTIAGAVTGVVLLAGVVGFGVGLPELVGDDAESASSADLPRLPDRLDDRMVALSAVTPEQAKADTPEAVGQMEEFVARAEASEQDAEERLAELYGAATVRGYLDVPATTAGDPNARPAQLAVTVVPGEPGLLIPNGPFQIDQSGAHYELQEIDGHRCSVVWSDSVDPATGAPTGEEVDPSSYQVECRAERDGLTYDVFSSGLSPEEVVGYLDHVLELADES